MIPEGDMSGLMAQAEAMQQQLLNAQQELAEMRSRAAGGDLVTVTMTGAGGARRAGDQAGGGRPGGH